MSQDLEVQNLDLYKEASEISKALCNGYADRRWFENQYQSADFDNSIRDYDEFASIVDDFVQSVEDKVMGHKRIPVLEDERQAAIIDNLELPKEEFRDAVGEDRRTSDGPRQSMYSMDESGLLLVSRLEGAPEGWSHLNVSLTKPPQHRRKKDTVPAKELKEVTGEAPDGRYTLSSMGECYKELISDLRDLRPE